MPSASCPPSTPAAPPPARKGWLRQWTKRTLLFLLLLTVAAWFARVTLANWALSKLPGFYAVKVSGVLPGWNGLTFTGVTVIHRPTGLEMARAGRVEAHGGWGQMKNGQLEKLRLVDAQVSWREEFSDYRMPYIEGAPAADPAVIWHKGEAEGGSFQWIERGQKLPRLSMDIVSINGGHFTVFDDTTCEADAQSLIVGNLVSSELTAGGRLTITSTAPRATGIMTGKQKDNAFTIEGLQLTSLLISMEWREQAGPSSIPEPVFTPPRPDWDLPLMFRIASGAADSGRAVMLVQRPSAGEPVEFAADLRKVTANGIRLAGGLPGMIGNITATLADMKAPRAAAEWRELFVAGSLNEKAQFLVTSSSINGAKVSDSAKVLAALGFTPEEARELPLCRGGADAKCVNLLLSEDGLQSNDPQEILLHDFSAQLPGEKEPAAALPKAEIIVVPDEALRDRRLRSVVADNLQLQIDKTATLGAPNNPSKIEAAAHVPPEEKPVWFGWNVDSLTVLGGRVKATNLGSGIPNGFAKFDIQTAPIAPGGDSLYQIKVSNIKLANPLFPSLPIPTGGALDLDVHPLRFWKEGAVERAEFNGQEVELNSSFMKLFKPAPQQEERKPPGAAAPGDKEPKPTSWLPPLRLKKLVINNVRLSLDDIGDGRRLVVPVNGQEFSNVPLSADLLEHDAANVVQKIEVPSIYVYAPYDEGRTVVELPVNFIHFSFAGLAKKQLSRVELVAPRIRAGRPLFDFVDRARARFSEFAITEETAPPPESGAPFIRGLLAAERVTLEDNPAVWDIPFFTDTGMVITAPNGEEWTDIPRLPFRNARIKEGPNTGQAIPFRLYGDEVTGELAIDEGWYDFPAWKLRLHMSGEGKIIFNYPLADKSNNLVQVFKDNTLIYRQLRIDKVWLSITYDREGIYATYGGETCGGYISGNVNLYLDQTYTWDASASMTGIDMKPLTTALTREYVSIDGRVDQFNVVAHGDMTGLYQTRVDFKIPAAGRLRIHALDALQKRLTDERLNWSDDASRAGVDMLRDFSFLSGEGTAKLYGREGNMQIKLAGRDGSRDININLHDYRRRAEKSLIRF